MDAPTISIKIRGLQALEALNGNGQLLGGMKIQGGNAVMGLREIEGNRRAIMAKKGMMMREVEIEGRRRMMLQATDPTTTANAKGLVAKTASATSMATSPATSTATIKGVAAKGAAATGTGALAAHGVGWGLGLGGLGPWLALAALGLAATGIYFYMRAQQLAAASVHDNSDLDQPV
jgi:hypothetical protein